MRRAAKVTAPGTAMAKRAEIHGEREQERIGNLLHNAMLPILRRALDEAVPLGAKVVVNEVVEADAHAEESIESMRVTFNAEIAKANETISRQNTEAREAATAAAQAAETHRRELAEAKRATADERERRMVAENRALNAERELKRIRLGVLRQVEEAKAEA